MDRYQKVQTQSSEAAPIDENEIRITSQGLVKNYLSYAITLLYERKGKEIVLKAMGQAISKAVAIAEIIKRKFPHLHQDTAISSVCITDVWEPIEEGLVRVEQTRHVSMISIVFSPNALDENSPGYQAPAVTEPPKPQYNNYHQQQPPRQGRVIYHGVNEDSYDRGRDRGRGRGRGWSRGGYGNYQENGGYSNWNRGGGRVRNWGNRGSGYESGNGNARGNGYDRNNGYQRGNEYNRGNGYQRGNEYDRSNGYQRGNGYDRGNGYNRGDGYDRGDGYYRGGGNGRGNWYGRGGAGNQRWRENNETDAGNERGHGNNERGARNERGAGYEQQGGRVGDGRRGGYGRGRGRMGGHGRGGAY